MLAEGWLSGWVSAHWRGHRSARRDSTARALGSADVPELAWAREGCIPCCCLRIFDQADYLIGGRNQSHAMADPRAKSVLGILAAGSLLMSSEARATSVSQPQQVNPSRAVHLMQSCAAAPSKACPLPGASFGWFRTPRRPPRRYREAAGYGVTPLLLDLAAIASAIGFSVCRGGQELSFHDARQSRLGPLKRWRQIPASKRWCSGSSDASWVRSRCSGETET